MNLTWAHIGAVIADFAPNLGSVLGGPYGALVGEILQGIFNAIDPQGVMNAMVKSPDAQAKIQNIEQVHSATLQQLNNKA